MPDKFVFPGLKSLCIDTITETLENRLPGTRSNEYHQFIDEHQGVHKITESLLELFSSEIRDLEGREVSRTTLTRSDRSNFMISSGISLWKMQVL